MLLNRPVGRGGVSSSWLGLSLRMGAIAEADAKSVGLARGGGMAKDRQQP
jgi:hypothetical protein